MTEQQNTSRSLHSVANHDYWAKKFWSNFLHYINTFESKNPEELNAEIVKEITDLSEFLTNFLPVKSNFLRALAQKYFSKNPTEFIATYKQIIEKSKNNPEILTSFSSFSYSYDPKSFRENFLIELLIETRNLNPELPTESQSEFKELQSNLTKCETLFEKRQKHTYILLLVRLGEFLKKLNLIEEYSTTYNNMLSMHSLRPLGYPAHVDEKNCKSIDTLFSENFLNSLTLPKLIALSGFWINKSVKAIVTLNEMLFIVNKLNLWDDVIAKKRHLPIDQTQLGAILEKTACLSQIEEMLFDTMEDIHLKQPSADLEHLTKVFNEIFDKKIEKEEKRYKKKFDRILPNLDNNLQNDISAFHEMANTKYLLYRIKDMCIFNLLMGAIDKHYSKNWGIIPSENMSGKFVNISFDIEGLNMPLRLHVYQSELIAFLTEYTGKPVIPLYKGANDMKIYGQYISSAILAPSSKKQNSFISEQLANPTKLSPDIVNFLKHLKFLKDNSKLPPSIKNESPNTPNTINLVTGERSYIPTKEMFR